MKLCGNCDKTKSLEEFNNHAKTKDGKQVHCRSCSQARSRKYYTENKEKHKKTMVAYTKAMRDQNSFELHVYLSKTKCMDCPETDPVVMEFDHVRGKKVDDISNLMKSCRWGSKRLEDELAKCDVVCANCHRKRTAQRARWNKLMWTELVSVS